MWKDDRWWLAATEPKTKERKMPVDMLNEALPGFTPEFRSGIAWMPVFYMRGGTSTGVVLWHRHVPDDTMLLEELLRHLMGVPLQGEIKGNKQITGLGRGPATSNKVFIVAPAAEGVDADYQSTLAQLASDHSRIDWGVNCGNMSSALPLYLWHTGLVTSTEKLAGLRIWNSNTRKLTVMRMPLPFSMAEIPGVPGQYPEVELALQNPAGAKTGKLFPTGSRMQIIDGAKVSCVDAAVPMVIVDASDLGRTAKESLAQLQSDHDLLERLRSIWVQAGLQMGLKNSQGRPLTEQDLKKSETVPKVCMISPGTDGTDLHVRYFTPQTAHASLAVTGGCCLAVACLAQGTIANELSGGTKRFTSDAQEHVVRLGNPAGCLQARVYGYCDDEIHIPWVAYQRSAQLLMQGMVPLYHASEKLSEFFRSFQTER